MYLAVDWKFTSGTIQIDLVKEEHSYKNEL